MTFHYYNSMHKRQEDGVVSMLSVIILSILLTIITTAFVRIAVSQQREATNADLSNRAYYAAQAGLEDGLRSIKAGGTSNSTCKSGQVSKSSNIDSSYTCLLIDSDNIGAGGAGAAQVGGDSPLTPGQDTAVSPLVTSNNSATLNISWQSQGTSVRSAWIGEANYQLGKTIDISPSSLITLPLWLSKGYPSMLRAQLFWFNDGTDITNPENVSEQTFYLNPAGAMDTAPVINSNSALTVDQYSPVTNAVCSISSGNVANCNQNFTLQNFGATGGKHLYLVVQSIYSAAGPITINLSGATSTGQATIDVTGKAGNVYRRLQEKIPFGSNPVQVIRNQPYFSLIGGNGICKSLNAAGCY